MSKNYYKLERVPGQPVSDAELLADLSRVAKENDLLSVSQPAYKEYGLYNETTISRRFGTWNKALLAAGLSLSNEVSVSDERLFENILNLWQRFGRQPRRHDNIDASVKSIDFAMCKWFNLLRKAHGQFYSVVETTTTRHISELFKVPYEEREQRIP